jgi:serine/threonine-protein kinase
MNTLNQGHIIASEHNEYKILGNLNQGSFGITYRAQNLQTKQECVIKKFQPKEENREKGLELFNREAEELKKIEHNQIPSFFEYFTKDNEYYLVQEYIKGHDLTEEIKKGINNEKYVTRLIEDILEVLSFLHDKGLIHRDLKPSNIRRRETDDKIVLIDFGGVKEVDQGPGTNLTSESYSPIEQQKGTCYRSSDVYAVGIIAIQSLTGESHKSAIFSNTLGIHESDRIEWHKYAPNVSKQLADIIDKMVMKDYKQRYGSAREALIAIKSMGLPTTVTPPKKESDTGGPKTIVTVENKINIMTATAVILIIIAVSGVFTVISSKNEGKVDLNKEFSKDNIRIKYNGDWIATTRGSKTEIFKTVTLAEFTPKEGSKLCNSTQITINIDNLRKVASVREYQEYAENEIKDNNPQVIIKDETQTNTSLSQRKAYQLSYPKNENQCETQVLEKGTVKRGKGYHVNYEAIKGEYERYLPVAEAMFESFIIEDEE